MAENTKISWATHTFNPWLGCQHATIPETDEPHPGCLHCYAQAMSGKFGVQWGPASEGGTRRRTAESTWSQVEKWNRQAACIHPVLCGDEGHPYGHCKQHASSRPRVFPSACDPFEEWNGKLLNQYGDTLSKCAKCGRVGTLVNRDSWYPGDPEYFCRKVDCGHGEYQHMKPATLGDVRREFFSLIDRTPNLDWLLLTKRPQNVRRMWCSHVNTDGLPPSRLRRENVWLLYSASDQRSLESGLPHLLECRDLVPVLGLSLEPLVGPVDLSTFLFCERCRDVSTQCGRGAYETPEENLVGGPWFRECRCSKINWVIVGGESGPHARPCEIQWIRDIVDQCREAGVPCFVKQDSGRFPGQQGRIPDDLWSVKEFPR